MHQKTHPEKKIKHSLCDFSASEGSTIFHALPLKQACIQNTANTTAVFLFPWECVLGASSHSIK